MYHEDIISSSDMQPADLAPSDQFSGPQNELQAGFELPSKVWTGMLVCYAVFFLAVLSAVGGSERAVFAIIISVLYAAMYFGLSKILSGVGGKEKPSPLDRGLDLQTSTGPMDMKSVAGQVLVVPACIAFFGLSVAIICAVVLP